MRAELPLLTCSYIVAAAVSPVRSGDAPPDHLARVKAFADCLLEHGRDRYGDVHTPLFASALQRTEPPELLPYPKWPRATEGSNYFNPEADNPNEWFFNYFENLPQWGNDAHKNGVVGEDMQDNEALYLLLFELSEVTGDPKYAREAEKAIRYWVIHTQSPRTGLFPWGEHLCWDFRHENVGYSSGRYTNLLSRRYHEGRGPFGLWKHIAAVPAQRRYGYWRDDLRPLDRYALGLWRQHFWDKEKILWDRHADYFFPMDERPHRDTGAFPWVATACFNWWSAACSTTESDEVRRELLDIMDRTRAGLLARQQRVGFLPWDTSDRKANDGQNRSLALAMHNAAERIESLDGGLAERLRAGAQRIHEKAGGKGEIGDRLDLGYAKSVTGRNILDKAHKSPGYAMTYLGTLERAYRETGDAVFLDAWESQANVCVGLFFDGKSPLPKAHHEATLPVGRNGEHGRFPTHYSAEWGCAAFMRSLLQLHVASAKRTK